MPMPCAIIFLLSFFFFSLLSGCKIDPGKNWKMLQDDRDRDKIALGYIKTNIRTRLPYRMKVGRLGAQHLSNSTRTRLDSTRLDCAIPLRQEQKMHSLPLPLLLFMYSMGVVIRTSIHSLSLFIQSIFHP